MDDNGDDNVLPFTTRMGSDQAPGEVNPDELVAPGAIYATAGGQRQAVNLEFIHKSGESFCVPYSHLPLLWWQPPNSLVIEYPNLFSVRLAGKELNELYRRIKDHRITWLREFDEHQAGGLASAVTHLEILRCYPSRDVGAHDGKQ